MSERLIFGYITTGRRPVAIESELTFQILPLISTDGKRFSFAEEIKRQVSGLVSGSAIEISYYELL